tara:strand:+ start:582 stop:2312 length:1731 start_codon:yes stop_codon:yes gene_type:complete
MPQQTRPNLQTDINTDIADNVTGAITAGDVRVNMINMTDSVPFLTGSNAFDGATTITGSLTLSGSSYPLIVKGKIDLNDGVDNIAVGAGALSNAGSSIAQNTAVGKNTLYNTLGNSNTALGYIALFNNTGGGGNVAVGGESIRNNTSGNNNSSVGYLSLKNNTTGDGNTALGKEAGNEVGGLTGNDNTFLGHDASYGTATTITNSTAVGANITLTNSNTVILGNNANVGINNTNPTEKFTVQGNILASGSLTVSASANSVFDIDLFDLQITGGLDVSRDVAVRDDLTVYDETDLKKEVTIGFKDFSNYDFSYQLNVTASNNSPNSARFDGGIVITGSSTIVGDITGSAFTGSFVGDGSALTGITSTIADGSVTNIKLANDSVTLGTTEVDLGTTSTTLAGLTDVKITGSLTVSGSGNTNILGSFYVYGASPGTEFFSTAYTSNRIISTWVDLGGTNLQTEIDPGNIRLTSNFTDFLTLRDNGTTKGLSREDGMRFTRLSFETGTITTDGVITIPKDVTGTIALELKAYTVASLPTGTVGDRAYVTDATSPTYLGTLTGGGAVTCPVFYNGSAWVSA